MPRQDVAPPAEPRSQGRCITVKWERAPTVWPGPPFFSAFAVLHPPERDPSGFGRENLEIEADAVAIFVLPSCADPEPEVVLPVLAFDDVKEGVRGLRHWTVLSLYRGRPMLPRWQTVRCRWRAAVNTPLGAREFWLAR